MKQPFLSVVVPLFNKEKYVFYTIQSVLNQSFSNFEIIVVDDCSTDSSLQIVEKMICEKIKIIQHHKNKGLSASRNTGVLHSKTDFVVFMDSDDIMKSNYLEKIVSLVKNFPEADLFATNYEEVYANNAKISPSLGLQNSAKDTVIKDFFAENLKQPIYCQSSLCVRKSAFARFGLYDETINYAEDVDFNIRSNLHSKLAYSPEKLVQYIMFDKNRITKKSILGKKIPDFDKFENFTKNNKNLKKYLDINRYMLANNFKKEGDSTTLLKLRNGINKNRKISGLNIKQQILLELPAKILQVIVVIKSYFLKKGFRFSSFD